MVHLKSVSETITAIEQSFDVNSVKYEELMIWPLIRLKLLQQLCHPEMTFIRKNQPNDKIPILSIQKEQRELLCRYKNTEILFFSLASQHTERIGEKFYNPYMDPTIELVREHYSFLKIEILDNIKKTQETLPRFEPTIFINPLLLRYETDTTNSIKGFSELQRIVVDISGIQIDESQFIDEARLTKAYQSFFSEIFSEIYPNALFLVYFNHLIAMSCIWACKKFKTITIDIQHGAIGSYNSDYVKWMKIPPDKPYDLLPDYFWCWGQNFRDIIERWRETECFYHKPIVGGNIRLAKWIYEDDPIINDNMKEFYTELKQYDKVILVALGGMADPPLPKHFFDTMRCSPHNWLWLIRFHPIFYSDKDRVIALLQQYGTSNYEIEYATSCPLYSLLKRCDHVIIDWSSVFYEALAFCVPTTTIDPTGLQFYEDEIKKGLLVYADTSEKLLESIRQGFPNERRAECSKYIETNREYAENTLSMILNSSLEVSGGKPVTIEDRKISVRYKALSMNQLGSDFFKRGYIKAALNTFLKAFETDPSCAVACNNLAVLYCQAGEKDNAIKYFVKAIENAPSNHNIIFNVAEFLKILGKIKSEVNMMVLF